MFREYCRSRKMPKAWKMLGTIEQRCHCDDRQQVGQHRDDPDPPISPPRNVSRVKAKKLVGRSNGQITYRKPCQWPAPSIRAASMNSFGTSFRPARKTGI